MQGSVRRRITSNPDQIAIALGWFRIGLGVAEVLAPRAVAKMIGTKPSTGLMRLFGVREIVAGIGILSQQDSQDKWLKPRVAGDALDLLALGSAMSSRHSSRGKLAFATAAVAGVTAVDMLCAAQTSKRPFGKGRPVMVHRSITINKSPEELYGYWRNFEQLPRFMNHLQSVTQMANNRSHWVAKGPVGMNVEWDAQITEDRPNELIAWQSLAGADVDNSGSVRFEPAPHGRGTIVRVHLQYNPPAGKVGSTFAKLLGQAPEKQVTVDLLRFKQMIETNEIARTEGQPAGRPRSTSRKYDDLVRA